jgi:hypothetical protein
MTVGKVVDELPDRPPTLTIGFLQLHPAQFRNPLPKFIGQLTYAFNQCPAMGLIRHRVPVKPADGISLISLHAFYPVLLNRYWCIGWNLEKFRYRPSRLDTTGIDTILFVIDY